MRRERGAGVRDQGVGCMDREQRVGDVKGSKSVNSYWLFIETFETDFTKCNNFQLTIISNLTYV